MRAFRATLALLACALLLGLNPGTARAEQSQAAEAGLGAAAALCSLVYGPTKIVYALGGTVVGGFAWLLSAGNYDVMNAIITPAVRGDYVVTSAHLRGERSLEFIGRDPAYQL